MKLTSLVQTDAADYCCEKLSRLAAVEGVCAFNFDAKPQSERAGIIGARKDSHKLAKMSQTFVFGVEQTATTTDRNRTIRFIRNAAQLVNSILGKNILRAFTETNQKSVYLFLNKPLFNV